MDIFLRKNNLNSSSDYLIISPTGWDDRGYNTSFEVINSNKTSLGTIKIAHSDMDTYWKSIYTTSFFSMEDIIDDNNKVNLNEKFYSIGSESFYKNIWKIYGDKAKNILESLNDVVHNTDLYSKYKEKNCFIWSLSRGYNKNYIEGSLRRIAAGVPNVKYSINLNVYKKEIYFEIDSLSYPPVNTYAVIGPNASGKTKLLLEICENILNEQYTLSTGDKIVNVTYVSFSPFDNPEKLNKYHIGKFKDNFNYIGLFAENKKNEYEDNKDETIILDESSHVYKEKNAENEYNIKNPIDDNLYEYFNKTIINDLLYIIDNKEETEIELLKTAIDNISYDPNIKYLNLKDKIAALQVVDNNINLLDELAKDFSSLSSGYKIVLITIISLIRNLKEQSVLIIDEPELFLHPPLVLKFINEINKILSKKNSFSIMVTHSPVVVQEIPIKCVYRINRSDKVVNLFNLSEDEEFETYGGNISEITRAIFGLEIKNTGFYFELSKAFKENGYNYKKTLETFNNEVGREGRQLLRQFEKMVNNEDD